MGTIRDKDFARRPCLCGKGEIVIDFLETDHAWGGGSEWYEAEFKGCDECNRHYILDRGRQLFAIVRADVEERGAASQQAMQREEAVRRGDILRAIRDEIRNRLSGIDDRKKLRAVVESLGVGISPQRLAADSKRLDDPLRAAMSNFDLNASLRAGDLIGFADQVKGIRAELAEIEKLRDFGRSAPRRQLMHPLD